MKARVWTESDLHVEALTRLQAEVEVLSGGRLSSLPGVDAAIIGGSRVDGTFLDRAGSRLRLVVRHGIGYDAVDVAAATERGILVANTPDAPTESTAEHTVGLLLAVAKKIVKGDQVIRANAPWSRPQLRGRELLEQRLGVVGYGRIGRRVVEICALGLKMPVLVYDPYLDRHMVFPPGATRVKDLPSLLSQADFVSLHTPLTAETRHLISGPELRLMKPGSYLINASRGAVVDESALIRALQDGHLAGAGLDVFDPEPPNADNPLLRMDNVVITPHIASNTGRGVWRMSQGVVDQVLQVLAGERPTYLLNPTAWPGRAGRS